MIFHCKPINLTKKLTGFTLIELLIVLVIMGLLASVLVPDMFGMLKRSEARTEIAKIKALTELSIERSFFGKSTIQLEFSSSEFKIIQLAELDNRTKQEDTEEVDDVDEYARIDNRDLKALHSRYFQFEDTSIKIVNGEWQGDNIVKLLSSSELSLSQLRLRD
ncbi:type II secretion system protein [Psychromonas sp. PT13]|uniref:type II secretion system protein n=1 Tax=Psychromonas sp. PT13 TaxID=3439547 RepID=UPI003EBEF249